MKVSIASLIYQSQIYADSVYWSLHQHTPLLRSGDAGFFFVANDPTPDLKEHLIRMGYPHVIQINEHRDKTWMREHGVAAPEYLHRVYRGWNRAVQESAEICVLVNSDMRFSPGWLERLLMYINRDRYLVSNLAEPLQPYVAPNENALRWECGRSVREFDEEKFQGLCYSYRPEHETRAGGEYQPCAFYRDRVLELGGFPEGNVLSANGKRDVPGDEYFMEKFLASGGSHITVMDSVVYHFKEGEQRG